MVITRIVVVPALSPVDLPVINVTVVLVPVPPVKVTMVSTAIIMRYPDLCGWGIFRMNNLEVNLPQVLVDPQKLNLNWLPDLENPVRLTTDQGQVLLRVFIVVVIHHADVDKAFNRVW